MMAAAVQATPRPLSQATDSVHSITAPMAAQSSSSSSPRKGEDGVCAAAQPSQPSQTSSNAKHPKRHGNQPILVWLQRKIGGKASSIRKRQTSDLLSPNPPLGSGATESTDSATLDPSPKGTVRTSRKFRELISPLFGSQTLTGIFAGSQRLVGISCLATKHSCLFKV